MASSVPVPVDFCVWLRRPHFHINNIFYTKKHKLLKAIKIIQLNMNRTKGFILIFKLICLNHCKMYPAHLLGARAAAKFRFRIRMKLLVWFRTEAISLEYTRLSVSQDILFRYNLSIKIGV
jgi:hypothetical protein